ncbi:AraC family transcriptional regulator [Methylobacterium sp. E-005]|uniref:helix-turn-helix transcriptional regulator n=1 Tax=Methylobacterium sp. E-005 TaxID=2836549 RepID=UPI001FBAC6D8|nr:AraC family transcriptional regulator [Methylobacterium sp. E-005]MCJ2089804.1 AraC family transcriptional regulator [Methylobacterium sp. E-005]
MTKRMDPTEAAALMAREGTPIRAAPAGGALPQVITGAEALPFRGRTAIRLEPDLGIASVFGPSRTWCDEGPAERLLLVRPAVGRLQVTQGGRTLACCSRDALLVAASRGAVFAATAVERIDILAIERRQLAGPLATLESGFLRRIGRDHPGLQTLTAYAAGLLRGLIPAATAGLAELARAHLAELLAVIVREPDLQANGPVPSRRDQRIQALKAEVEQRLGSPDLSLDTVARAQRISSRQIQALFQAEGETFSGFVLTRRLDRAMQRLTDGDDARPVGAIAFDVGFGDLSYFNRTFRRRFGLTPSQARRLLRRADRVPAVAAERVRAPDG